MIQGDQDALVKVNQWEYSKYHLKFDMLHVYILFYKEKSTTQQAQLWQVQQEAVMLAQ